MVMAGRRLGEAQGSRLRMPDSSAQLLAASLDSAGSVEDFDRAARAALESLDELGARIVEKGGVNLACRAGCSLCCWLRVDVFAHEVFLVAHYVWTHFSPEQLAELTRRLTHHQGEVLPLTPFEHATTNIPCPLLRDGRCSVYAARPASCRRQHSRDLAACEYTFDHPDDLEAPAAHDRELFRGLTEAMLQGIEEYARLGFDHTIYELGTALAEALRDPACWSRWRDGGRAFLHASVTPPA